jgi:cytochrome c2
LILDGLGSKTTVGALTEFLLDPARFDPSGRMPSMLLSKEEAFQLAAYLIESRNADFEQPAPPGDAERGKALVASEGCLACHALSGISNTQRAPQLTKLDAARGCLADSPPVHAPRYRFTGEQRAALRAFLTLYAKQPDVSPAPVYNLQRSLHQLRCVNCHSSDFGSPVVSLNEAAPPLDDIGSKLRSSWIAKVMGGRQRSRKYLALRMPHYDARHAGSLEFAKVGTDPRQGGMGCVGCHDWGEYKSLGEEGPQLINVTDRLRADWYQRWMRNPARILSGTSMPNYFSAMESGRADRTIASLWAAMALGAKMPLPAGLGKVEASIDAEARPVPDKEPIVVRWDMPEATPAAIAVGLPGGLSYCFDAGESRLRYAWSGGFVDLTETLTRKTDRNRLTPTAAIVGEVFFRSVAFPFRVGAADRIPQRRFRGYRIAGGLIEFRYDVDGIGVIEQISPVPDGRGIERQFTIARVETAMWFLDPESHPVPRGVNVRFAVTHPLKAVPPSKAVR